MIAVLQGLVLGLIVGVAFGLFRLQPPPPATWAGVAGIALGWMVAGAIMERLTTT